MGHPATRARIAGILSLCLLLSSLGATGALASAAPPQVAAPQTAAIVIGSGSCVGFEACTNAVGPIADNSCIGDYSCQNTTGSIGAGSCTGTGYSGSGGSCTLLTGNIGVNSCNGDQPCGRAGGINSLTGVGDNACNGGGSCLGRVGSVGDDSCDGGSACLFSTATIGDNSCTGNSVCYNVSGAIGNDSCSGSSACNMSTSEIGNNSCNGKDSCVLTSAGVGDNSCNGLEACYRLETAVGDCANNLPGSVPAACVVVGHQPDARIRRIGNHNMVGDNIYNADGTNQTSNATLGDRRVRFVISIQNDGDVADSFTIGASTGVFLIPGPAVRFYHG